MDNKFVWLIGGIVLTYFYMKNKAKKELIAKVDNAVSVTKAEDDQNFKKAIDLALTQGKDLAQFKADVNS